MPKHVQTLIRRLAVVQAIVLMLVMGATPAFADSSLRAYSSPRKLKEIYSGTHWVALNPKSEGGSAFLVYHIPNRGKVSKIKSSKESVAGAWFTEDPRGKDNCLVVEGMKPGTAKISYTYKGKRHTATFVFKKWTNPVKSLTIGKKQCAKYFKTSTGFRYSEVYGKGGNDMAGKKLKVTAAKGWKIKSIKYTTSDKLKTLKNGGTVPKAYNIVIIQLKNNKTGATELIWML